MNTDQLLEALKPYGVDLQWKPVTGKRFVLLLDWSFASFEDVDKTKALQMAYDAVTAEQVGVE